MKETSTGEAEAEAIDEEEDGAQINVSLEEEEELLYNWAEAAAANKTNDLKKETILYKLRLVGY